jgi:hypothetical protein
MAGAWTRALDVVAPGFGAAARSSQENTEEAKKYGTQAPGSEYQQAPMGDPALQKDAYRPQTIARGGHEYGQRPGYGGKGGVSQGNWMPPGTGQAVSNARGGQQYGQGQVQSPEAGRTTTPYGYDQSNMGVSEQYWQNNQDKLQGPTQSENAYGQHQSTFAKPGEGEQYWNQVQGNFNKGTNAQAAYDRAAQQGTDPGLGQYYDRAKENAANSLNDQLAAMGMLGTSVGAQKMGQALTGLDAERANREADFVMRQNQMLGNLGAGADSQNQGLWGLGGQMSQDAQNLGLNRAEVGMNAAQNVDTSRINQFQTGMNAAGQAQGDRRTRTQDMFNNTFAPAQIMADMVGNAQNDVLQGDQDFMDASAAAEMGLLQDMVSNSQYKADRQKDDERHGMNMAQSFMSMGGGGG